MKTFVINLDRAPERWDITEKRLRKEGFEPERIAAIDGHDISDLDKYASTFPSRMIFGRNLSPTEIGCYMSHAKVWQNIVDHNIPTALILEDDAVPVKGCKAIVCELDPALFNLDILRLHILKEREVISKGWLKQSGLERFNQHSLFFQSGPVWSMAAYLITRNGARTLLKSTSRIRWPVDCLSFSSLFHGIKHGVCLPLLFSRDNNLNTTMQPRQKISPIQKITSGYFLAGRFRDQIITIIDLVLLNKHHRAVRFSDSKEPSI